MDPALYCGCTSGLSPTTAAKERTWNGREKFRQLGMHKNSQSVKLLNTCRLLIVRAVEMRWLTQC